MDCSTIGLPESNNDNSRMNRVQQRNCVVKITVRSQNGCANTLSSDKYRIVIVSRIAHGIKTHSFVSALFYQVRSRPRKVLVKEKLHSATLMLPYGTSSKLASVPANANTADKSSEERLG